MPDDPNQNPPKPDPGQPEQGIRQNIQPGSNIERSVAGEMPTADHERAALKLAASSGDGKNIQADPLSQPFNTSAQPPEPPEPIQLTPIFNDAAAPPPPKFPERTLDHTPPEPTPSGPGGAAQVSPKLRDQIQNDQAAKDFKARMLKKTFNEKARDSMDRDR
jgi:hypothetical protein